MAQQITRGEGLIGQIRLLRDRSARSGDNHVLKVATNNVERTDTSSKDLFELPAEAVPIAIFVFGDTASDAGTSATIDIGITGTQNHFVDDFDVAGATGTGLNVTTGATNIASSVGSSAVTVTGTYFEDGAASTTGGPWEILMLYR